MKTPRCEGWRRRECPNKATVILTVMQAGQPQTLPACATCWNEARNTADITVLAEYVLRKETMSHDKTRD
jgi:hypothetical protein